jgi:hypothetical protein
MGSAVGRLAVSQYFTEFGMSKPGPAKTWDLVEKFAAGNRSPCSVRRVSFGDSAAPDPGGC